MIRQVFLTSLIWTVSASAQWIDYPTPNIPRLPNGKVNLAAPVPKAADGKPDLSGLWQRARGKNRPTSARNAGLAMGPNLADFMRPGETIPPLLPALRQRSTSNARRISWRTGPPRHCLPHSIPDQMLIGVPMKIVQNPGLTLILYEEFARFRQIFTDGRGPASCGGSGVARLLHRQVGRRLVRGRHSRLQRQELARRQRPSAYRSSSHHRALPPHGLRSHGRRNHHRRSGPTPSPGRFRCSSIFSPTPT